MAIRSEIAQQQTDEPHLETSRIQFKAIVLGTDFSPNAQQALQVAAAYARRFESKLVVVHAVPPIIQSAEVPLDPEFYAVEMSAAVQKMKEVTADLGFIRHEEEVLRDGTVSAIQAVARKHGADLIVMGSHGASGLEKIVLGSVAEATLRHSHIPVMVVGPKCEMAKDAAELKAIVFATDLGIGTLRAAQYAASIAEENNAKLVLVHVGSEKRDISAAARSAIQERLKHLLPTDAYLWSQPSLQTEVGDPSAQILRTALIEDADLIVVGTREAGPLSDHAPWSTVSKVIRGATCPVLAVCPYVK